MGQDLRFYGDLAPWWPLISPPEDYEEEAAWAASLLERSDGEVAEVLELGSGGGHSAVHLRRRFAMALVDLSPSMLERSRALNPGCRHEVGDMRTVRLGRTFDAVLLHDAVDYMATEDDLRLAVATAYEHVRPGGVAVFIPDHLRETWEPDEDVGGSDGPDGRGVRFLEWSWDPDPDDTWVQVEYAFVLRHADGRLESVHESHRTGLFGLDDWLRLLGGAGFDAEPSVEVTSEDRPPRTAFVARRPR